MPDDLTELNADIAQVQNDAAGFGTGRLVAENLVLTAAHTLRSRESGAGLVLEGWQVRLERDHGRDARPPFRRGNRVIWCDQARDLALIQLVDPEAGPLRPRLRLRVATVSWINRHSAEARGYPRAGKQDERPRELIPVCGHLAAALPNQPLFFGVDPADLPNHPHEDWPGISGSAVVFNEWPDRREIWVYGVVREVPANFNGQLWVSGLAEAWREDADFRSLLVTAGAPDLDAEDPTVLRIQGANPVTIYQPTERLIEPPPPGSNPYKGLLYFDETDAQRFFGRERLTEELYARLTRLLEGEEGQLRLLPVLGPSGSGKSSLVRAGLVPRLAQERRAQLIEPRVLVLTPGPHPLEALARALARLAPGDATPLAKENEYLGFLDAHPDGLRRIVDNLPDLGMARLILVIDQFEELYVTAAGPKEREAFEAQRDRFVATLIDAASDRGGRLIALVAMRSDFLGATERHPELNAHIAGRCFVVPAMGEEELENAIRKPAEQARWPYEFQEAFVDLLVNEVLGRPGALPLLQFALQRVWDALPTDPAVTLDNLGGIGGVVAGYAENEFGRLPETDRSIARRAFLAMVNLGETADTRRRARLDEITAGPAFAGRELWVLRQFARPEARLVTLSQEPGGAVTFEVAHETLIGRWDRLQEWLHEGRDDLIFLARAREAAAWWEEGKGPLWDDFQLKQLSEFALRSAGDMTERLTRFRDASLAEKLWERRRRRRSWAVSVALIILVVCAASVVIDTGRKAQLRTTFQLSVEQAERAVQAKNYFNALQSAVQAWEMRPEAISDYDQRAYEVVRETLAANQRLIRIMQHDGPVWAVAFDRTGEFIATGANDKTARLWDARTGKAIGSPMRHGGPVLSVAFDPSGELVATGSQDNTARLWNARTGEPVGGAMLHDGPVMAVAFDPKGELLLTASQDKTARLWNARTGGPLGQPMQHDDAVITVAFDPSGQRVVTGSEDAKARLWDARTGKVIGKPMRHENAVLVVAIDPMGEYIATGSRDKTARLWNARTAEPVGKPMSHGGPVWAVAFDPRSDAIVTGSGDRTARLWKVRTCEAFGKAMQHDGPVATAGFDPRGRFVLTGSLDKTARLWDGTTGEPIGKPMRHEGRVTAIAFSRSEELVVTGSEDNTIRLWDTRTAEPIEKPLHHDGAVDAVAFAPAGNLFATGSEDNTAKLWSTLTAEQVGATMRHDGPVLAIAFSPEGNSVVTGSQDSTARLWNAETGEAIGKPMQHDGPVLAVAFDQKREIAVTGSQDNTARLWNSRTSEPIGKPMQHDGPVIALAVDPAGKVITTASQNSARLWDAQTGAPLGKPMQHRSAIKAIALNSTGTLVATGAEWKDNTAQLWDARTGDPVGSPMRHDSDVLALAFDPTGELLATGSADNTARLWNAHTGTPVGKPMDHSGPVVAVVFDRRGRFLATGSGDNTARLWEARTGHPIGKPMEHGGPVWATAFDARGKLLATGSDNAARLWLTLSAQTLFERARVILGPETEPVRTPSSSPDLFIWIEKKIGTLM
jgi:WD40 repeat protein